MGSQISLGKLEGLSLSEISALLLNREETDIKNEKVTAYINGKTILVTGGGGSIGSEICRQLIKIAPRRIIIFDIYENTSYELLREIESTANDKGIDIFVEIGSIRDIYRLEMLFAQYHPDIVFHAAAHKHVPLMENNPREAILNNVTGTLNVAKKAIEHNAKSFVLISTDKAVNPTSVMGATKRICETIIKALNGTSDTVFCAVRFGNVLGSHGSMLPLFLTQMRRGGPITVTDKSMTRFFMTIAEASRLVITAGALARGGEIFVLDMGEPVCVYEIAMQLIELCGAQETVEIVISGLRPGEKLYEELIMPGEDVFPTENKSIVSLSEQPVSLEKLKSILKILDKATESDNSAEIKRAISRVVNTYQPNLCI